MIALCKVCGGSSPQLFTCDLNANARANYGFWSRPLPEAGVPVEYYQCEECGFLFTDYFDDYSADDFKAKVYNDEYPVLDNGYQGGRAGPMANALLLGFRGRLQELTFLDYGCGTGVQTEVMRKFGANATGWDPYMGSDTPKDKYDVVTCSEIMEHSIDPLKTVRDLIGFLCNEESLLIVTTQIVPEDIGKQLGAWWYVSPAVSHCSFYTKAALRILFRGFNIVYIEPFGFVVFRRWPAFAEKLLPIVKVET